MSVEKDSQVPPNLEGLATLLVLQDQIKNLTNLREFGYFSTNETHRLFNYNTSYLWKKGGVIEIEILAQSENAEVDLQSPVNQWIVKLINELLKGNDAKKIQALDFQNLDRRRNREKQPEQHGQQLKQGQQRELGQQEKQEEQRQPETPVRSWLPYEISQNWPDMLPRYLLWSPFLNELNEISGGLIFFREQPFTEQEIKMFRWLSSNYQYTWTVLTRTKLSPLIIWFKKKPYIKILLIAAAVIMLFPIRMSTKGKGTVESSNPAPISASIPGIINEFFVKPGEAVKKGQPLLSLDKTDLTKSYAILERRVQLDQAKLRSAINQGYDNAETRNEIPIISAQLAVDQSELEYTKSMLNKTDIVSPIEGIAVFEGKEDWIGQPVQAGENIMTIADVNDVLLKISLTVTDLISLEVGSKGNFYVYGNINSVPVELTSLGYNAKMNPNHVLAYQYTAKFTDTKNVPRIGNQGVVHLYGDYVPLIYYLMRRPIQALRQTIGF